MDLPKRKRIRLEGYDYSQNGAYFITICTENRINLFGEINNGTVLYNDYGIIALAEIENTNKLRINNNINITKYIVMPNHIHMIIEVVGSRRAVTETQQCENFAMPTKQSVPTIIRAYKAAVTKKYHDLYINTNRNVKFDNINMPENGHGAPCPYRIWQSRYHDHTIRNEQEYRMICDYIDTNPLRWNEDCLYSNLNKIN
jgi:hypothetical protein